MNNTIQTKAEAPEKPAIITQREIAEHIEACRSNELTALAIRRRIDGGAIVEPGPLAVMAEPGWSAESLEEYGAAITRCSGFCAGGLSAGSANAPAEELPNPPKSNARPPACGRESDDAASMRRPRRSLKEIKAEIKRTLDETRPLMRRLAALEDERNGLAPVIPITSRWLN